MLPGLKDSCWRGCVVSAVLLGSVSFSVFPGIEESCWRRWPLSHKQLHFLVCFLVTWRGLSPPADHCATQAIKCPFECPIDVCYLSPQVERYLKQAVVDKSPAVASAVLVSAMHLLVHNSEIIKRWVNEIQEAAASRSPMVRFCRNLVNSNALAQP